MKTARQLMTVAWLAFSGHAMADGLAIADFSIQPGETKTIAVELNNTGNEYIAFEFYMSLPEGVSIAKNESSKLMAELNSGRINGHKLKVRQMADGSYYFFCYSESNANITGTSGEILSVTVTATETAEPATGLTGILSGQVMSDTDREEWNFEDLTFHVDIGSREGYCPHGYLTGDVNMDRNITISDITEIVKIIRTGEGTEQVLCPKGCLLADVNSDGEITNTDVTMLIKMILDNP